MLLIAGACDYIGYLSGLRVTFSTRRGVFEADLRLPQDPATLSSKSIAGIAIKHTYIPSFTGQTLNRQDECRMVRWLLNNVDSDDLQQYAHKGQQ